MGAIVNFLPVYLLKIFRWWNNYCKSVHSWFYTISALIEFSPFENSENVDSWLFCPYWAFLICAFVFHILDCNFCLTDVFQDFVYI